MQELTPLERNRLYYAGEEVDRLPHGLLGIETGCSLYGIGPREALHSPEKAMEVADHLVKEFDVDSIGFGPDLKGLGEAVGSRVCYPEWNICYVEEPVLKDYGNLKELYDINLRQKGRLPQILETLKRLKDKYGNTRGISNAIAGPMSTAASIRGTENLLKDMLREPEQLHRLLDFTVELNRKWVQYVWESCRVSPSIADPVASLNLLGVKRFREFEKPYLIRLCKEIREITGKKPSLHICGKTKGVWEDFRDLGISSFSLDNCESLRELKETTGDVIGISGNVNPTDVMRYGTPEDVEEAVKNCLKEAADSPKGYAPGAGCQIPLGTPRENLHAFCAAVEKYTRHARIGQSVSFLCQE